ncbi:aliphatic sulfonate ABC transporter substrate-binding protein [Inquilinus limosus]|uniref:aliphatic sulfonate ABC transporter substrate-binding protein n=1 Tax=Inquilinus limosus TaxID=171674 RepID=UPI0004159276|nr:aliphatic sulfonate ABC transporter substrate-binding protein [Inquilinus limosus]
MITLSRRLLLAGSIAAAVSLPAPGRAAEPVSGITLDWAYYNPVSLVLKEKGWLEEALTPQGVSVTWVQSAGSNKAIEFLNSGSVQFGSTAGAAALLARINGSPIKAVYSYSRPEWTALVTNGDSPIQSVEELKGKRVAVTRGTDPYIFLLRALADHGLTEQDIEVVLLQHADGRNALIGRQVDAWAGLDPMMAQAELEQGARLFCRKPELNTYGVLNVNEQFAADHPEIVETVIRAYERARRYALEHPEDLRAALVQAAGLTEAVAAKQLERTDLSGPAIDAPKRDTILNAGLALQLAGAIDAGVDVAATVDALLDARFKTALAAQP